jgi:hypothetical protein
VRRIVDGEPGPFPLKMLEIPVQLFHALHGL